MTNEQTEKTLRDEFAMAALQGLLATLQPHSVMRFDEETAAAYRFADAMMEARKQSPKRRRRHE